MDARVVHTIAGEAGRSWWGPGDMYTFLVTVFVPRGTAHSYRNETSTAARMIAVYTPAGLEGWFREVCMPVDDPSAAPPPVTEELIQRMLEAGPRYSVEWVD